MSSVDLAHLATTTPLSAIVAAIPYIDPLPPPVETRPFEKGNQEELPRVFHSLPIWDVRPVHTALSLDGNGFVRRQHHSAVTDFHDPDQLEQVYRPEIEALVQQQTGADRVILFHMLRRKEGSILPPARVAHIDYSEACYRRWVQSLLPADQVAALQSARLISVNVWRPLVPIVRTPLCLCDPHRVSMADLKDTVIIGPSETARMNRREGYHVKYSPHHRWYYLSAMQTDEVWIFKQYDSDPTQPQRVAHCAFEPPEVPADAPPRESIEVRALAFLSSRSASPPQTPSP